MRKISKICKMGLIALIVLALAIPVWAVEGEVQKDFQTDLFTGSVSTSVPIETFSGPGGLAPHLAISYSSLSANQLGAQPNLISSGWDLAGSDDKIIKTSRGGYMMILNGVGYDLVLADDGWHTNPESFINLTRDSNGWKAIDRTGKTYYFGQSDDSILHEALPQEGSRNFKTGMDAVSWSLDYVEDTNGNGLKYEYRKFKADDGHEYSIILQKITCCYREGNLSGSPQEVLLVTSKKDVNEIFKKNGYWVDQKLDAVEVRLDGKPLRKYALDYDQQNNPQTSDSFENPGFETGNTRGWETHAGFRDTISVESLGSNHVLKMHLESPGGNIQAWQKVTVPKEAAYLKYKVAINWVTESFNGLGVYLYSAEDQKETPLEIVKTTKSSSKLEERNIDLSNWKGKEVTVYFRVENLKDDDGAGEVFLDDVTLGGDDSQSGTLTLKSVTEYGSDGKSFQGTLPPISFEHKENLLTAILNEHGGKTNFKYEKFISQTEKRGVNEENERSRVTEVSSDNGLGDVETTHYAYTNSKGERTDLYDLANGEFRGHANVSVTSASGVVTKYSFDQSDDKKGMLNGTDLVGSDGKLYERTSNQIESKVMNITIPQKDQPLNPGFDGNILGWTASFSGSGYVDASSEFAYSGSYSAKFMAGGKGTTSGKATLRQDRAISNDAKFLSFMGRAVKYPAGSKFRVLLDDGSGNYEIFSGLTGDEWKEYTSDDISKWAGKSVSIIFEASQDADKEEIIAYIDDVKFLHRTPLISFPYVSETRDYSFEGRDQPKMMLTAFTRDDFGNPTDTVEYGEYDDAKGDIGNDKRETSTEYINDLDRNILGVPKHQVVSGFDINDNFLAQRENWMYYDNQPYGKLTKGQLTKTKAEVNQTEKISSQMGYDEYGNPSWTIDAKGNLNPRTGHTTDTEFDSIYHAYSTRNCNALDYCSQIVYDDLMRAVGSIDINGQATNMSLDFFGRAVKIAKPGDSLDDPTEKTVYQDKADFAAGVFPFVETVLKDGTEDGLRGFRITDGMNNVMQTKKEGVDKNEWLVTDSYWCSDSCVDQNSRGRLDRTSVPYSVTTDSPEKVNRKDKNEIGIWMVQGYDPIGRPNRTTKPDGTAVRTIYGIWQKDTIDAMNHKASEYSDGLGEVVRNENYLGDSEESYKLYATTAMKYNTGSGELVRMTDPQGNELDSSFDMLGRKTNFSDPDLGFWQFKFDANGNTVNQTDAKGQTIGFVFDSLDRMILKDYPTDFDTTFFYDDQNSSYGKGYLYRVNSYSGGSGKVHTEKYFQRDVRGRVVNTTVNIDNFSWSIGSGYNSLDWVVNQTYPDGEVVTTRRNSAGMIDSPDGKLPAVQSNRYDEYPYLKDVTFWQGKPESYAYGNGRTSYREYNDRKDRKDPFSGRSFTYGLYELKTDGDVQDLQYGLDDNGNVRMVLDGLNSTYSANYVQDDLSRLIGAESGVYGELNFSYDSIGNILSKDNLNYTYPGSGQGSIRPHVPTSFGNKSYDHDANGNMIKSGNLTLLYNFDNYVEKVRGDCGTKNFFGYDESGERVVKKEKGKVVYHIGGIYEEEWLNGQKSFAVKYYSAGDSTIVRKVNLTSGESNISFIHTDQLGSSTRITNSDGELTLSMGYKPYGEESYMQGEKNIEKLFTGKEKDEKTGLYYYGARYYDPNLARFITPDPVEGMNRYEYVRNNPVNLIDPSGYAATMSFGGNYPKSWFEPLIFGIRPIDIMVGTMPGAQEVEFSEVGSQVVAKPIAKRIAALAPEQLKKIAAKWERYDLFKSKQNAIDLVKVASEPRNEMNVKTDFNPWMTQGGKAEHMKGDWKRGANSVSIGQRALETQGRLDATLTHEYYHDLQWRGGVPIEYNLLETQAYDISLQTHLLYLDNGPAEVKAAGETYLRAVPYAKLADNEAGESLGYVEKFNAFFDKYIKPRI